MPRPETTIPYAPIRRHAIIGDRRTAALVAADGTIDWMCLPDYGGEPAFAALLDARRGGYFRFGPRARAWGTQRYVDGTAVVETRTSVAGGELVAQDAMPLPDDVRPEGAEGHRVVLRRLVSTGSRVACLLDLQPRR
ncbi:MAG TPA: trehalase-like domain-containing protein, partial [Polyangiaceae bacterium]